VRCNYRFTYIELYRIVSVRICCHVGESNFIVRERTNMSGKKLKILIRDYRDSDNAVVTRIWMEGFHEMSKGPNGSIKKMQTSLWPIAVFGGLGALSYIARGPYFLSIFLVGFGVSLYTPIGSFLYSHAFWQAIKAQAKQSMAESTFHEKWMNNGGGSTSSSTSSTTWDKSRTHFFVAQLSDDPTGTPIGCVGIKSVHTLHHERDTKAQDMPFEASIWRLSVDDSMRGEGIGRLLMQSAEKWAKDVAGCKNMTLITGNEDSKVFYTRVGYKPESEERALAVLQLPSGLVGFFKARILKSRLYEYKTIFRKQL